ncbi:MAG: hypothetical protein ACI87E_000931, partial [Mariniblastus sp.]
VFHFFNFSLTLVVGCLGHGDAFHWVSPGSMLDSMIQKN